MVIAETSSIQYWTLFVAILAVMASVFGIFFSAHLNARSEYQIWKRDRRSQYHSELDVEAQIFKRAISKSPPPTRGERLEAFYNLYPKMTNVSTYGTVDVRDAAFKMFKELGVAVVVDSVSDGSTQIDEAIEEYRQAVRKALKFDD
jgi:hypothetical protein